MRGYALTVFEGVKPESMDVEVLGVMHNTNGPKGDIILIRLHGAKVEYTGVVAGMSGSLPHWRVLERTDRWGNPNRGHAGNQCTRQIAR